MSVELHAFCSVHDYKLLTAELRIAHKKIVREKAIIRTDLNREARLSRPKQSAINHLLLLNTTRAPGS